MQYFAPGLREFSRFLARQIFRVQISLSRHRLAKAEATLGLLGWEQADFDPDTQDQVRRIIDYEREQTRTTNERASLGHELRAAASEREAASRRFAGERNGVRAEREQLVRTLRGVEEQVTQRRRIEPTFERRIPELDRELREVTRAHSACLAAEPQTAQIRNELIRLRERSIAIPNEKNDLRRMHLRTVTEIRNMETKMEELRGQIADSEKREGEISAAARETDEKMADRIKGLEKRLADLDKTIASLEGAKSNPYRQVGRVLADSGVAPLNQPQALEQVLKWRAAIVEHEAAIERTRAARLAEEPLQLRQSLLIWLSIGIGFLAFVALVTIFR